MNPLFTTTPLGRYTLRNRLVMAPMTRSRADDATGAVGNDTVTYYAQRADAGLIISEGSFPSAMGKGYVRTPGINSEAQIAAWRLVTDAVHQRGGRIFLEMMQAGSISNRSVLPDGAAPVAPSAIRHDGQVFTATGLQDRACRALWTPRISPES